MDPMNIVASTISILIFVPMAVANARM